MTYEPEILLRDDWGATKGKRPLVRAGHVVATVWHHSGDPRPVDPRSDMAAKVREIQQYHLRHPTDDYSDIAYNWLIGLDGRIFEGRGWEYRNGANGIHEKTPDLHNGNTISVCCIGNFEIQEPTHEMKQSMAWLAAVWTFISGESRHYGHRDLTATACNGAHLYPFVKSGLHIPLAAPPPPPPPPVDPLETLVVSLPELRQGDSGLPVRRIQGLLWLHGAGISHEDVNGNFGPSTKKAIVKFREDRNVRNLDGTVLDYCDQGLWKLLLTVEA